MGKNYTDYPILSEVLSKRKKREKKMLIIGIPGVVIMTMIIFMATAGTTSGIMRPLLITLLFIFFISIMIAGYFQMDKMINNNVMGKLGINSYKKMEKLLEKCRKLDEFVFISEDSIIDFFRYDVIKIRSITEVVSTFFDDGSDRPYGIKLKVRAEGKKCLCFGKEDVRDKVYKIITTSIDFRKEGLK